MAGRLPARLTFPSVSTTARSTARGADELVVVVVNTGDWTCHTQDGLSATVRKIIDKICD